MGVPLYNHGRLLVWSQNETELILLFTDTGTHADPF